MRAPYSRDPRFTRPHWDRGDGYDARDPDAPKVATCAGCDALVFDGACADCTLSEALPNAGRIVGSDSVGGFTEVYSDPARRAA